MDSLAGLIHRLLTNLHPFAYNGLVGTLPRAKVNQKILEEVRGDVAQIAEKAGIDFEFEKSTYPHHPLEGDQPDSQSKAIQLIGFRVKQFLNQVCTANILDLLNGDQIQAYCLDPSGNLISEVLIKKLDPDQRGRDRYVLQADPKGLPSLLVWLRNLSDGYTIFDSTDIYRKVEGPVVVELINNVDGVFKPESEPGSSVVELYRKNPAYFDLTKSYYIGAETLPEDPSNNGFNQWSWDDKETVLKKTELHSVHTGLEGKLVPFAGWEMPVRYSSVMEEHHAVRETAGLFDVSHMGVFEISGPNAITFLDLVFSNYAAWLEDGQSLYGYFLDNSGRVIDDGIIYRIKSDYFYLVCNASNEDKVWDWLTSVNQGRVLLDRDRTWIKVEAPAILKNLKDPNSGKAQRRDLALQGPTSLLILQTLTKDPDTKKKLGLMRRTELITCQIQNMSLVVARTGYTGEDVGFEILVHPDQSEKLWKSILKVGEDFGVKPAGLGCRDSTRIEAGLPLYGSELAGPLDISPIEAGFPGYVKYHKPFFVGREALLQKENGRQREIVRFRCTQKRSRKPNQGDEIVNQEGKKIGQVTSCSVGSEGCLIGLGLLEQLGTEPGIELKVVSQRGQRLQQNVGSDRKISTEIEITVLPRFPEKGTQLPSWMLSGD
jgi:glycine hydroxymethyltransferase